MPETSGAGPIDEPGALSSAPQARSAPPTSVARPAFAPSRPDCPAVEVFASGESAGRVCVTDAAAHSLTLVDLSDGWTPRLFAPDPATGKAPAYRAKYLELAGAPIADLGLFGIAPNLSVLAARLASDPRRACDAAVDRAPLVRLAARLATAADDRARAALVRAPEARAAVQAAGASLACAGLLRQGATTGTLGASMHAGLDAFRRRHMVVGTGLDRDTVEALVLGGDELAFRGLLRGLRERVADAAGLIEDGSASGDRSLIVDRLVDLSSFAPSDDAPLEGGAPDLVGRATDATARALGWTSPASARRFLAARGPEGLRQLVVAVALPPAPAYHSAAMELRVEIDRGDVLYETPGRAAVTRTKLGALRRPRFVLYATDGGRDRPLVRWSTTIGGWKKERTDDGEIVLKYKESDVGERFWRQLIAAPAWLPPDSTPETDLVRELEDGDLLLKQDVVQPGYRNAYGLVMLIHEQSVVRGGEVRWADHGIRTHGSVDYRSISRGESHGCHRLYNQLALRLSGYLLEHRPHVRRGTLKVGFRKTLLVGEQTLELDVPERGYLYELDPPVPVRVLAGTVAGEADRPLVSFIRLPPTEPKAG